MRKLEQYASWLERKWVRLFSVEHFAPCSWAFALAGAPSWVAVRGDSFRPRLFSDSQGSQPRQPARPDHRRLDASVRRPPAHPGHSRGGLVRFPGKGDASAMAVVTTRFSGRAKQRLPEG